MRAIGGLALLVAGGLVVFAGLSVALKVTSLEELRRQLARSPGAGPASGRGGAL